MGSEYKPGGRSCGVIPEAIGAIFNRIAMIKDYECCVRVSFVEIHKVCVLIVEIMACAVDWGGVACDNF